MTVADSGGGCVGGDSHRTVPEVPQAVHWAGRGRSMGHQGDCFVDKSILRHRIQLGGVHAVLHLYVLSDVLIFHVVYSPQKNDQQAWLFCIVLHLRSLR